MKEDRNLRSITTTTAAASFLCLIPPKSEPQTACHVMADIAQDEADDALRQHGGTRAAINAFDKRFTGDLYLGRRLDSMGAAYDLANNGVNDAQGRDRRQLNSNYFGESGFQSGFQQGNQRNDQTHHFAAYLSAGINGMRLTHTIHKLLDDNKPDKDLGSASFALGRTLRRDPSALSRIGSLIRSNICAGPGRGLYGR